MEQQTGRNTALWIGVFIAIVAVIAIVVMVSPGGGSGSPSGGY